MNEQIRTARARASYNGDFFDVTACSGYRISYLDPGAASLQAPSDASDQQLGRMVLDALAASRFLTVEEAYAMRAESKHRYEEWVAFLISRFGYRSRRALFKNMMACFLRHDGEAITIRPSHHDKLEAWSGEGFGPETHVVVRADQSLGEIGSALRLAFSRCT